VNGNAAATAGAARQHANGHREVKNQARDAEQAGETRKSVRSALDVRFEEQVQ
jgi:hypothetical protein